MLQKVKVAVEDHTNWYRPFKLHELVALRFSKRDWIARVAEAMLERFQAVRNHARGRQIARSGGSTVAHIVRRSLIDAEEPVREQGAGPLAN